MDIVAKTFQRFKEVQLTQDEDLATFKAAKKELKKRLNALNETLNKKLYQSTTSVSKGIGKDGKEKQFGLYYDEWQKSHQPFHWLAEFYEIIHDNGGFDVIIGNPPYVEYFKKSKGKSVADIYSIKGYSTIECGNLYAYIIERCKKIINGVCGYIVPSASVCTPRMEKLAKLLQMGILWTSIWDERPSTLFDGVDQQLCIHLFKSSEVYSSYTTRMNHWAAIERPIIFRNVTYMRYSSTDNVANVTPKIQNTIELQMLQKLQINTSLLFQYINNQTGGKIIYYKNAGGRYWRLVKTYATYFRSATSNTTTTEKTMLVTSSYYKLIASILSSSTFYWFWRVSSNCRHLTNREMDAYPIPQSLLAVPNSLNALNIKYEKSIEENKSRLITNSKSSGEIIQDQYNCKLSKPIIDEIDKVLAKHYGFTEEELDFIINYDIKYRMGDELNED
jgi:hypothetical protein